MVLENGQGQPLPSKRFQLYSRLYSRFLLEPLPAVGSNAALSPLILPTTDVDELLRVPELELFTVAITSAVGFVMATVPAGERWTVTFIRMVLQSGTWTHNRIDIEDPAGTNLPIDRYTASADEELKELINPLVLDEGWDIVLNVNSFTAGGDAQLGIYRLREDAF